MTGRSLKDRITTSTATLFVTLVLVALLWLPEDFSRLFTHGIEVAEALNLCGYVAMLFIMLALHYLVNDNALMRVRTWMAASVFLILNGIIFSLHSLRPVQAGVLLYVMSQYYLLKSYEKDHAERFIVASFMFLGTAAIFYPPILYLGILYFLSMLVHLHAFTPRSLLAGLFGVLIPIELYVGSMLLLGNTSILFDAVNSLVSFGSLAVPHWTLTEMINTGFVVLLFLIAYIHYSRTKFNDKIRTRMYFYVMMLQTTGMIALLALKPSDNALLLPFIVMECSPIIAHYLIFSRGIFGNIFFILIILLTLLVAAVNIWTPSLIFC